MAGSLSAFDALAARFPLETVDVTVGAQSWQITCVVDQDALLDGVNAVEHVPYGFLLWESAVALAQLLLERRGQLQGKRVLELGAGVGLAGLVAQRLGATVWQTDHRADLLVLAAHNAQQNHKGTEIRNGGQYRYWERLFESVYFSVFQHALEYRARVVLHFPSLIQS